MDIKDRILTLKLSAEEKNELESFLHFHHEKKVYALIKDIIFKEIRQDKHFQDHFNKMKDLKPELYKNLAPKDPKDEIFYPSGETHGDFPMYFEVPPQGDDPKNIIQMNETCGGDCQICKNDDYCFVSLPNESRQFKQKPSEYIPKQKKPV